MKQNRPWTEQELKQVETEYLKGEKIKAIAYRLERSTSSLNKILSRYGIRNLKTQIAMKKGYVEWDPRANYCEAKLPPIIEYQSLKPRKCSLENQLSCPPKELKKIKKSKGDNPWVSLRDVVDYIKSKGIRIEALRLSENEISTTYDGATFFLDHKPSSPLKVVLFANKLRLEEGKQTFLTEEVTW
ncbi:MAG: hypothetical protein EBT45_05245 [Alphaproteobacteria bacterium]|nr:hypothetical protein [Alphaproteobacteria bacterium]